MNSQAIKYLNKLDFAPPHKVDRIIVSAYLIVNNIKVTKNIFIKSFIIKPINKQEYLRLFEFIQLINAEYNTFGPEELITIFEHVVSPKDKIINGAIYTPLSVREYIIKQTFKNKVNILPSTTIADISCGSGGFLLSAAKELKRITKKSYYDIYENHIFGLDIQSYAIKRAKILLSILAIIEDGDRHEFKFNLFKGDALNFKWNKEFNSFSGFDIIIGNPPYVCSRHLSDITKQRIKKWSVSNSGHPDLYILFFQIGIELLTPGGILGYISMNTFFKSLNGRGIREYFHTIKLKMKIIDFGMHQVFESRNTYTCICIIENSSDNYIQYLKLNDTKTLLKINPHFHVVDYSDLCSTKGWNLQKDSIINKIESTGTCFGELYKTRSGIATLKNEIYIFNPIDEDNEYYYLQNGNVFKIEKNICREIINPNRLNNENKLSNLKEKIIFPYDNNSKPSLFPEKYFKANFPYAYKYLKLKKNILSERDKGKGLYDKWYAFGRTQSLEKMKHRLFFPHIANKTPNYLIHSNENLLFYNGLAVIGKERNQLLTLKKLMESKLFWYYIEKTSKPYSSGYYSLSNNYIKSFGICVFNSNELQFINNEENKKILDEFFEQKYEIIIPK